MKEGQRLWTRDELILAINLYCKMPFGQMHGRNPEIIKLAELIGRTAGAVGWKLNNFAGLDPSHKARGIAGAKNASKQDAKIWDEFYGNWEEMAFQSEVLRAQLETSTVEKLNDLSEDELPRIGEERMRMVKQRVNQNFFRKMVLGSYNNTCCITGINEPQLLVASHIRRWADDPENRMNPSNGLAMNALHDRAFEVGLIGITPEFQIKVSSGLLKSKDEGVRKHFSPYHDVELRMPRRFFPDAAFLKEHFERRFLG